MALTKSDIVAAVHELGFTKKKSVDIIETLLGIIKDSLEKNEDVLISGFGKFCVKEKNQRRGRNPATGETEVRRGGTLPRWRREGAEPAVASATPSWLA